MTNSANDTPTPARQDGKTRFTRRVPYYHISRPRYPIQVLDLMRERMSLSPTHVIADIGAGTGISSELFLGNGNTVYAIEPNEAMLAIAIEHYGQNPRFRPFAGSAESTTLADNSVDFAVAGQAFHWFNLSKAKIEISRIVKADGWVMLFWNMRHEEDSPLQRAYNQLMQDFDVEGLGEFRQTAGNRDEDDLNVLFGAGKWQQASFPNQQVLDFDGFKARVLSASYMPLEGEDRYDELMTAVQKLFADHHNNHKVTLLYRTDVYWGKLK
jgi:SAM-dependent methyltransferase